MPSVPDSARQSLEHRGSLPSALAHGQHAATSVQIQALGSVLVDARAVQRLFASCHVMLPLPQSRGGGKGGDGSETGGAGGHKTGGRGGSIVTTAAIQLPHSAHAALAVTILPDGPMAVSPKQ